MEPFLLLKFLIGEATIPFAHQIKFHHCFEPLADIE